MRYMPTPSSAFVLLAGLGLLPSVASAQAPGMAHDMAETAHGVTDGGIKVPGWMGAVDGDPEKAGNSVKDARLAKDGAALDVTTGPAITYWSPANKATGDYTVSATFSEAKYMNLNSHPHPYGIAIAGNDMGTPQQSYVYCAAYGNGTFIVRGFGPDAFQMNGRRPAANEAIHKAAAAGQPVSQTIAMSVKGDKISCSINGAEVATFDKSALVTAGKLKSTDGVYGIRFAHNTDAVVTDLKITRP